MLLWCAGNDYIHLLTSQKRQVLHVDLGDWEGNTAWAEYDDFKVGNEATKYKLISLGEYSGDAGESVVGWKHNVDPQAELRGPSLAVLASWRLASRQNLA